jgi:hypothetical protein
LPQQQQTLQHIYQVNENAREDGNCYTNEATFFLDVAYIY